MLGADPIILIGQDLAYSGNRTHAPDTHLEDHEYDVPKLWLDGKNDEIQIPPPEGKGAVQYRFWSRTKVIWVDGVDGEEVPTDRKLLSFLHWFEEVIENLKEKRTIIDATEGGALIRGTQLMTFNDALEQYCREDLSAQLAEIRSILHQPFESGPAELLPFLKKSKKAIERLVTLCAKGTRLSKALFEHYESGKDCDVRKVLRQLDSIDRYINETRELQGPFHYVIHAILGSHANSDLHDQSSERDIARQSLLLYHDLQNALSRALPLMGGLIHSLEKSNTPVYPVQKEAVIQAL
jgi:hypothetical protein